LVERGGVFRPFVRDFRAVENGRDVLLHGSNKSSLFGSENFGTPVLFLLLNGAVQQWPREASYSVWDVARLAWQLSWWLNIKGHWAMQFNCGLLGVLITFLRPLGHAV